MKSLKFLFINTFTVIVTLGLLGGSFSSRSAQAARFDRVPALKVSKLGNLNGQTLTVIYAIGSRPFISTDSSQITITAVKEFRQVKITNDTVELPEVQIAKEGFRPSYNLIVLAVSPQENYSWRNADGSIPQGVKNTGNHAATLVHSINKKDVDDFVAANGEKAVYSIDLKR